MPSERPRSCPVRCTAVVPDLSVCATFALRGAPWCVWLSSRNVTDAGDDSAGDLVCAHLLQQSCSVLVLYKVTPHWLQYAIERLGERRLQVPYNVCVCVWRVCTLYVCVSIQAAVHSSIMDTVKNHHHHQQQKPG